MKAIVKLLAAGLKHNPNKEQIASDIGLSVDDFNLVLDGTMEISPALAMKLEQTMGIDAHDILNAQSADQLAILGKARTKKVDVPKETKTAKAAKPATDGQPKQSSMTRRGVSQRSIAIKL